VLCGELVIIPAKNTRKNTTRGVSEWEEVNTLARKSAKIARVLEAVKSPRSPRKSNTELNPHSDDFLRVNKNGTLPNDVVERKST